MLLASFQGIKTDHVLQQRKRQKGTACLLGDENRIQYTFPASFRCAVGIQNAQQSLVCDEFLHLSGNLGLFHEVADMHRGAMFL